MGWQIDEGLEGLDHNILTGRVEDLVRWRVRRFGRVARTNDAMIKVVGIASANSP